MFALSNQFIIKLNYKYLLQYTLPKPFFKIIIIIVIHF